MERGSGRLRRDGPVQHRPSRRATSLGGEGGGTCALDVGELVPAHGCPSIMLREEGQCKPPVGDFSLWSPLAARVQFGEFCGFVCIFWTFFGIVSKKLQNKKNISKKTNKKRRQQQVTHNHNYSVMAMPWSKVIVRPHHTPSGGRLRRGPHRPLTGLDFYGLCRTFKPPTPHHCRVKSRSANIFRSGPRGAGVPGKSPCPPRPPAYATAHRNNLHHTSM